MDLHNSSWKLTHGSETWMHDCYVQTRTFPKGRHHLWSVFPFHFSNEAELNFSNGPFLFTKFPVTKCSLSLLKYRVFSFFAISKIHDLELRLYLALKSCIHRWDSLWRPLYPESPGRGRLIWLTCWRSSARLEKYPYDLPDYSSMELENRKDEIRKKNMGFSLKKVFPDDILKNSPKFKIMPKMNFWTMRLFCGYIVPLCT